MAIDTTRPRTRRAILGAAAGAVAASAVGALARPLPAVANDDIQAILVGSKLLDVTLKTSLGNVTNDNDVWETSTSGTGRAVNGTSHGIGVAGTTLGTTGYGVYGFAGGTSGVSHANTAGVRGENAFNGPGVSGASTTGHGVQGSTSSNTASGVFGGSPAGHGIHGQSSTGWAGYFDGRVLTKKYHELVEIITPTAPSANHARLFVRDSGSGKTQLCVRFSTGVVKVLATEG